MNRDRQTAVLPDSPFPGIEPFSYADRNIFFARRAESRNLIRLIVIHRGVLLYSDSGTGKSSLINAGLLPAAIAEGLHPERIRVHPRHGQEFIVERLSVDRRFESPYLPSMFAEGENQDRAVLSVEDFLSLVRKRAQEVRPLLIFDQFEEWVTLFEERSRGRRRAQTEAIQQRIEDAIVALLADRSLPVKILIVLREDYLAKFTRFLNAIPIYLTSTCG